jgi:DNA-binding XRE family transcriptional regulator
MELGTALKAARCAAGLSRAELARELMVCPDRVYRMETGRKDPSWTMIVRFARHTGHTPKSLIQLAEDIRAGRVKAPEE